MASPFDGLEVEKSMRPSTREFAFDLDRTLSSVLALESRAPEDAVTARALGTRRLGNGVVISPDGLVLTIGYLITEAEEVILTAGDGRQIPAHVLGYDQVTGFGLVNALEPLDLPPITLGDSRRLSYADPVILAGGGGRAHAVAAQVVVRAQFAGYWEYLLKEALFTEPAHPHWSGAALLGPSGELLGVGSLLMDQGTPGGESKPVNMCVPIELLPPILDDLSRGRPAHAARPWLGIFAQDLGDSVVVLDVTPGAPAARAELRRGDLLVAVHGKPIADLADFYQSLWRLGPAGVTVPLTVQREREVFDVEIRSADRSSTLKKRRFN